MVNIKTRRSRKGLAMSVGAGYGSFNTRSLSGFLNDKPGKWDYLLSADHHDGGAAAACGAVDGQGRARGGLKAARSRSGSPRAATC